MLSLRMVVVDFPEDFEFPEMFCDESPCTECQMRVLGADGSYCFAADKHNAECPFYDGAPFVLK